MNINSHNKQHSKSKRPSVDSQLSQKISTQQSFLNDKQNSIQAQGPPSQKSQLSSQSSLRGALNDIGIPFQRSSQNQLGSGKGSKQQIVVQNSNNKRNSLNNKKYSLDDKSENYVMKLQEYTHEGSLEFQQRKFSQPTDIAPSEKSITPAYSHNQPINQRFSPFYFHQDNQRPNDHQVKHVQPHRIEIIEETPLSARQNSQRSGQQQIIIPPSYINQHYNSINQNTTCQQYPQPHLFNPYTVPHFGDNPLVNNSSFHSQLSNTSFAQMHQASIHQQNLQSSFSAPSYNNSLVLPAHQKTNSLHNPGQQSSCILNQVDNNSCHSSFGISQMSQQLPCQCTSCLQAQMAYLQQLLVQQQQLYLQQQALSTDQANESMDSQHSNQNNTSLYNHPKPQNLEKQNFGSNSIPSNDDSSIPDEIYSMQSQEEDNTELDREQRILKDQIELQQHYERFMQQELLEQEQQIPRSFGYELNINPNPQENILKKNYIELPLGEIPEMKESFYEDQSRYTNSSMSKKFATSQFGIGMGNEYQALQRSSCKKSSRVDSHRTINRLSISGEKENQEIYETFPADNFISRNPQINLHQRNFSHQGQNNNQQLEAQPFNQYGTVVTPHKQRQLSGSNWGTSINKDITCNPYMIQPNINSGNNHHRQNSSFIQSQQLLQVFNQQQMQTSNNNLNMTDISPFNKSQMSNENQILSSNRDDMVSQVNEQYQLDEQQEVQQFVKEFQNNQQQMMINQQQQYSREQQMYNFTIHAQQSRKSDIQPDIQQFEDELEQQFGSFHNNPSFQNVVIYTESSFDKQEDHVKRREFSSSIKNQSYEKDKTDKLIQYILENEPYQNSGRNSKRGEGLHSQRHTFNLSQRNLDSSLKKCDNIAYKTVDSEVKVELFDEYFHPVSVAPFGISQFHVIEENENQKENVNPTSDKQSRHSNKDEKQCSNKNFDSQPQYPQYQLRQEKQILQSEPEVYRVQTLLKKHKISNNSATKQKIDYVMKDARSRSVEPSNGRIFQKYNPYKTVSNNVLKPIREQRQMTTSRDKRLVTYEPIRNQRWQSQPANNKKPLNSETRRLSQQQNIQKQKIILNSKPRPENNQQNTQLVQKLMSYQTRQLIQQAVTQRLTTQTSRGKNAKQQSRQPRQLNNRQSLATPIASRKQESIFTKLANQNLTSRKSRVENSLNKQSTVVPQALTTPTNNYYLRTQVTSKKFQKTLFEMSELPTLENIQRSISIKRQQNQLIISLPKRKSSVQSNESVQNDLFKLMQNKEKVNRRSIENISISRNSNSQTKERQIAQMITIDEKYPIKKPIRLIQVTRQTQSSTKKRQKIQIQQSRTRSNKPLTTRNQENKQPDPRSLLNSIKNTACSFKIAAEKQKNRLLFSSKSPQHKEVSQMTTTKEQQAVQIQNLRQNIKQILETPEVRKFKISNPSEILATEESIHRPSDFSQPITERNSIYKNPFHNSNMASYRESILIPGQQHSKRVSNSFSNKQASEKKIQYAQVYQNIISSEVDEEDNINESAQEMDEDSDKNEIEFILSENHKSLNMNEINEIQQSQEIQNKINQYYKLKEVSENKQSLQIEQERFLQKQNQQQQQTNQQNDTIGNRDLHMILSQLEQSNRSRATTVQNFTSFNTLDQQEFMSFNSVSNVQHPMSIMNTIEKQQKGIVQEPIIHGQLNMPPNTSLGINQPTLHKGLDSGTNLIETPISKEISATNSERGTSKQYSAEPLRNSSGRRVDVYQSPSVKKKPNVYNNEKQNFCLPNALFFNSTAAQTKNQRNSLNRRSQNNQGPITQYNQIFRQTESKNNRNSSDIDVLRQSTDNSPQLNDYTNPYASSIHNSKNDSSIIIRSFGVDHITGNNEDTLKSFSKRANIPKYKKNDLNYMSTRDRTTYNHNQSSQKSSISQLSCYKADDEQEINKHSEKAKFRNLKLSQDEKNVLRERVEIHRQSNSQRRNK